ncbi:MAG: hypothetical protein Q4G19_02825 [Clostridia bacterium]|nr:hypothetical protein [Clostridia bacterium]
MKNERLSIEEALDKNKRCYFQPKGASMKPLLTQGESTVVIEKLTRAAAKGDVILFRSGDLNILHRVIGFRDAVIITRGDNNFFNEYVPETDVLGFMTGFFRTRDSEFVSCEDRWYRRYCRILWIYRGYRKMRIILSKVKHKVIGER